MNKTYNTVLTGSISNERVPMNPDVKRSRRSKKRPAKKSEEATPELGTVGSAKPSHGGTTTPRRQPNRSMDKSAAASAMRQAQHDAIDAPENVYGKQKHADAAMNNADDMSNAVHKSIYRREHKRTVNQRIQKTQSTYYRAGFWMGLIMGLIVGVGAWGVSILCGWC